MAHENGCEATKSLTLVEKEEEANNQTVKAHSLWGSTRMAIAIVGFFGFINIYALKVNMSVAMVCMVNQSAITHATEKVTVENASKIISECPVDGSYNMSGKSGKIDTSMDGEFSWSKPVQGHILGSFFYGYIVTQIPGGWLSLKYGGRRVLGWCMFACAISTLLMPVGARIHYSVLIILRIIAGLTQGAVWPAMHGVWSQWAPPLERSRLIGFTFAGSQIGCALTFPISGLLCKYGFDGGWPCIFYGLGGFGVLWFIAWMVVVYDSPAQHPRVSKEERAYIESTLVGQVAHHDLVVPWKAIFKSVPVWAIIVCHTLSNVGIYSFLTNIPTYMKEVLGFDIKSNGALSALPYILFWVMINVSSFMADWIQSKKWMTTTGVRKLFNTSGSVLLSVLVICLANVGCTQTALAVTLLTIGISFTGFSFGSGFIVNPADVAPNFSGVIFGLSNTFATVPGFAMPYMIARLTENQLRSEWQNVFYIVSGIYILGALFYQIFASGEVQPWAEQRSSEKDSESLKKMNDEEDPELAV